MVCMIHFATVAFFGSVRGLEESGEGTEATGRYLSRSSFQEIIRCQRCVQDEKRQEERNVACLRLPSTCLCPVQRQPPYWYTGNQLTSSCSTVSKHRTRKPPPLQKKIFRTRGSVTMAITCMCVRWWFCRKTDMTSDSTHSQIGALY